MPPTGKKSSPYQYPSRWYQVSVAELPSLIVTQLFFVPAQRPDQPTSVSFLISCFRSPRRSTHVGPFSPKATPPVLLPPDRTEQLAPPPDASAAATAQASNRLPLQEKDPPLRLLLFPSINPRDPLRSPPQKPMKLRGTHRRPFSSPAPPLLLPSGL
jgi:hypothetical protein